MEQRPPMFINSIGRSGSTALFGALQFAPNIAYLTVLADYFPKNPEVNRLFLKAKEVLPFSDSILKKFQPSEPYRFWNNNARGFSTPCRDLFETDVTNVSKKRVIAALNKTTTKQRNQLVMKITGWPRLRYLHEIYPESNFLHIYRDPRAVINSMLQVHWWHGWGGPAKWRWGELSEEYNELWLKHNKSFAALAAIEIDIIMDAFHEAKKAIPENQVREMKYEELCNNPVELVKDLADYFNLDWNKFFENKVKSHFRSTNFKWKNDLTKDQISIIEEITQKYLELYNYE